LHLLYRLLIINRQISLLIDLRDSFKFLTYVSVRLDFRPLLLALRQAKADGTYSKLLIYLAKQDLLILDDWGLEPLDTAQRNDVMEIMDDRNDARSTIIISQLPVDQWHQSIGDNTLADAILDRLVHNAHRMPLKGVSLRQLQPES